MFLLDTNVISELRKANTGKANPEVIKWASGIPVSQLYISVVTILELEMGVLAMERKDSAQGEMLRYWLETSVLPSFSERTLDFDTKVARCCAALHIPDKQSERDAMIAATGITHNMAIVTRNVKDFSGSGADLLNPWE